MDNFFMSLEAVIPLFFPILLGYILRNKLSENTRKQMNNVTFTAFLPFLVFSNLYNTDIAYSFNIKFLLFAVISVTVQVIALFIIIPMIEVENKKRSVLIQAIFRSNFVILGLPVAMRLLEPSQWGVVSLLIAVVVPYYNLLAVIVLEFFRGDKINVQNTLKGIIKNPLIIASVLGIAASMVDLPIIISNTLFDFSRAATPLSLFLLGSFFSFQNIKNNIKQITIGVVGRLVIVPAIFIPLSIWIGFEGAELVGLMCMFFAPCAASAFTMAQGMDADGELAGQIVVIGSMFSLFTMFAWIFTLKQFMLIP